MENFDAIVVSENQGSLETKLTTVERKQLSAGSLFIQVAYSSLNYKDMLATQKGAGVIRNYPMIPGIDLAGTVIESRDDNFLPGQKVLVTGYQLGMSHTGGFAEYAQVPAEWAIPLPEKLSLKQSMIHGTAGLTAALSLDALEKNGLKKAGRQAKILVTGANGGVGSLAIQLLRQAGYETIDGLIRKEEHAPYIEKLGATPLLTENFFNPSGKRRPLEKSRYDAILDTVGGQLVGDLLPFLAPGSPMTLCGNAAGLHFETTVLPFILRGIHLIGIDSVEIPLYEKKVIWQKLATDWFLPELAAEQTISLADIPATLEAIRLGRHHGRTLIEFPKK